MVKYLPSMPYTELLSQLTRYGPHSCVTTRSFATRTPLREPNWAFILVMYTKWKTTWQQKPPYLTGQLTSVGAWPLPPGNPHRSLLELCSADQREAAGISSPSAPSSRCITADPAKSSQTSGIYFSIGVTFTWGVRRNPLATPDLHRNKKIPFSESGFGL